MIVVDGANVIGSRPDGWWRDRAGAAERLHARLVSAGIGAAAEGGVVLVLEGAARAGVPEGSGGGVRVAHAAGDGDDEIVAQAIAALSSQTVAVVTADRGLRRRLPTGVVVHGPDWLLGQLD